MFTLASCHIVRFFYWNLADINDYKKFPAFEIQHGDEKIRIPVSKKQISFPLPEQFQQDQKYKDLEQFLDEHKTVAFLVLRNDTIIYEKYFDGFDQHSIFPVFSIAKSFVSALTGIAIAEGYIRDVHQPITEYLLELDKKDFSKITIEHLLNMRSGIKYNEGYYNPLGQMAKFYYGRNLKKYAFNIKIKEPPDLYYDYISVNTQLLAFILERATGSKLSEYLQEKIWKHAGMEYDASWNYDSRKHQNIKAFCCINARPRDFAKFGLLYLHKGQLNGKQIIPVDWVERSTTIMNDSRDSQNYPYTYCWRVKEDGAFFAKGILGQYIYVYPKKQLVILRFGKKAGETNWADLIEKLSDQL